MLFNSYLVDGREKKKKSIVLHLTATSLFAAT